MSVYTSIHQYMGWRWGPRERHERYIYPHADIYVCTCCCICDLTLLCMCAHTAIYVSSCCYIYVLILRYMCVRIQVPASHYSFDSRDKMPPALYEFVNQEAKECMCPHTAIYVFRTAIYNGYKMPPALYEFVNQESNVHCLSLSAPHTTRHTSYYYIYLILLSTVQQAKPLPLLTKLNLCCTN